MERTLDISYEPFSREPEYIEANRAFVHTLPLKSARRVLDLACGTGVISDLILEVQPDITIFGLDLSRESLSLGQKDFMERGLKLEDSFVLSRRENGASSRVVLIEGTADCLPFRDTWADLVFMGHSIHLLPDRDRLLREVARVLLPGGLFAFNSGFYAGSQLPETDVFYRLWWQKALKYIMDKDAKLKQQGLPGIKRRRGTTSRADQWLSKDEWAALLREHGFEEPVVYERRTVMSKRYCQLLGAYAGFARVVLSGYPSEYACESLVETVEGALTDAGLTEVPRLWLEISARRPRV